MRWTRALLGLIAVACLARTTHAQGTPGRITGRVTDAEAGVPIPNVNVTLVGTRFGTQTATDGSFTIAGIAPGHYQVKVALIGYAPRSEPVTVTAGAASPVSFALHRVATTLSQMVVVGYGAQRRSDLTGAVSTVTPNVDRVPTTSLEQVLQGQAPGVTVTQASAAPGGGISIRIRGGSSLNGNNEPLYVIDGFPVENDPTAESPSNGGRDASTTVPSDPLAAINPNDIASVEILKDASATSIYGARGANGVIIITTKHGAAGKPVFTLDASTGEQSVAHRYDLLGPQEFARFVNDWSTQNGTGTIFTNPASLTGTDWQSQIFRTAPIRNLQIGVTGGTSGSNATRYALSGGVFQQDGVVVNSSFRRESIRGNLDQSIGSRFRIASNLIVSRVNTGSVPTDGSFNSGAGAVGAALSYYPILPVRQPDGTYTLIQQDTPSPILAPSTIPNPVSLALDVNDKLADTRTLANAFGEYTIVPGLALKVSLGADLGDRTRDTYYPRTVLLGQQYGGLAVRGTARHTSFLNENTLTYHHLFGSANELTVLGGYTRQSFDATNSGERNSNFVTDINGFNNIGAGTQANGPSIYSGRSRWTLASFIGRINYTLLGRYLFTLTDRRDGSSRFGSAHRWGSFPSAAVGWKLSDEPFMRRFTAFDLLKLRASYGVAGNPSIRPYQSLAHLASTNYTFGGNVVPGYAPSSVGNPYLGWETTKQSDFGLDVSLWHDRVSLTADAYRKRTDSLLLAVNLPLESGYSTALENLGSIENRGTELSLTLNLVQGDRRSGAFGWSSTFNYARNRNRVLNLGGVQQIFASSINSDMKLAGTLVQVGQPIGVFWGYRAVGIFRDSAQVAAYKVAPPSGILWHPGDAILADVNGDGKITAADRTIIGDPNPKWTGGWQNSLSWHGVGLTTSVDAVQGNKILNLNLARLNGGSPATNITRERYYNSWTPQNPNAKYPRVGFTPGYIGSDITSDLLQDGSYVRLRAVTLDYELPPTLFNRLGATSTRVYVTGTNLWTHTSYNGFNPDVSSLGIGNVNRGIDIGAYPLAKSVTFGVNLSY